MFWTCLLSVFKVNNNFTGSIPSELGNLVNLSTFIMSKFHNEKWYFLKDTITKKWNIDPFFVAILCEGNNINAGSIPLQIGKLNKCKKIILRKFFMPNLWIRAKKFD